MGQIGQQFLNELEKKLWTAADKLRSNLDAAVYKHAVLSLIFLKYVSDAFGERRQELTLVNCVCILGGDLCSTEQPLVN